MECKDITSIFLNNIINHYEIRANKKVIYRGILITIFLTLAFGVPFIFAVVYGASLYGMVLSLIIMVIPVVMGLFSLRGDIVRKRFLEYLKNEDILECMNFATRYKVYADIRFVRQILEHLIYKKYSKLYDILKNEEFLNYFDDINWKKFSDIVQHCSTDNGAH